ncbi:hypothetical protein C1645_734816 [Glomus cerebriforme]|uniref:Uncharacterized protein n=1 Tax=Glomus cerebriforme TaxID=658196 RepID=A0A397TBU6_9GLOM|nr:hypothetical protein C1645_734816 [Glomus cerebriforme]
MTTSHNALFISHMTSPITNNSTNALAVCNYCISKHGGLVAAQIKPECYTVNHVRLCHNHLAKYPNFHEYVDDDEVQKILALSVPEDNKMKRKVPTKMIKMMVCMKNFSLYI